MAWIQVKSQRAHLDASGKVLGKKYMSLYFQQTNSEIQPTADTEGQLCRGGSQGGEVQEEMINTRDLQGLGVSGALWK